MAKVHVFNSRKPHVSYICRDGTRVDFKEGIYYTANEDIIAELTKEARNNHPDIHLPLDEDKRVVEEEDLNPFLKMKKDLTESIKKDLLAKFATGELKIDGSQVSIDGKGFANSLTHGGAAVLSGTAQVESAAASVVKVPAAAVNVLK